MQVSNILAHYIADAPSPQHSVDLFAGEWSSQFPAGTPAVSGGQVRLFEDDRVAWAIERLGGVGGKSIIELGPLEGGHSYMLERAGAASILAIEANTRAYLRCLVVKEMFQLQRVRFVLGDFVKHLQMTADVFDVCVASGVLYHMIDPIGLIRSIGQRARAAFIWTHYYDVDVLSRNVRTAHRVRPGRRTVVDGFSCDLFVHEYGTVRTTAAFCGPATEVAHWMRREDIERAFRHFGFTTFETAFEQPDHVNGPAFSFVAVK
jgi:hypothetical protein